MISTWFPSSSMVRIYRFFGVLNPELYPCTLINQFLPSPHSWPFWNSLLYFEILQTSVFGAQSSTKSAHSVNTLRPRVVILQYNYLSLVELLMDHKEQLHCTWWGHWSREPGSRPPWYWRPWRRAATGSHRPQGEQLKIIHLYFSFFILPSVLDPNIFAKLENARCFYLIVFKYCIIINP